MFPELSVISKVAPKVPVEVGVNDIRNSQLLPPGKLGVEQVSPDSGN